MAYSAYLDEHIQGHLTTAIAEASIRNPKDAVDFIANFLLKIVDDDALRKEKKEIHAVWEAEDRELELQRQQKLMARLKIEEEAQQRKSQETAFYRQLASCSCKTEALQLWSDFVAERTKSQAVYIGSPCTLKQDDEDVNALLYNAVSNPEDDYLLRTAFTQTETRGVVFDLLKSEENEDAEEDDNEEDENAVKKEEPPKPRKRIHIDNVLFPNAYSEKLHYFKYPKVGSFLSFAATIKSYLNPEAIQAPLRPQWPRPIEEVEAEEKAKAEAEKKAKEEADKAAADESGGGGDEEKPKENEDAAEEEAENEEEDGNEEDQEEKEAIPDPPQTDCQYVVSMDTLGDEQLYDEDMVQWVDQSISKLEDTLRSIDVKEFLKQREHGTEMTAKLAEYTESMKAEIDAKVQEMETENESNPEEIKAFKKSAYVVETTQPIWSLLGDHAMKPKESIFCRIIAAFTKLFDSRQQVTLITTELTQFTVISDAAWDQCLQILMRISPEQVAGYNPSEEHGFELRLYEKLIDGITADEIGSEGAAIIMAILFEFVDAACKLFKFNEAEKNKPVEEPAAEPVEDEDAE